ncbi:ATP-binding cassette domain-containing protein [Chloroflexota bacterium]
MENYIEIIGAREHNLKDISPRIPKDRLVVITGISGSGKSSLVFDTIFAEAQRQLLETFSSYARSRLPRVSRPDVDEIRNLSPSIIIDQRPLGRNPRSTVGTVTEIYNYLRLLFSRCGTPQIGDSTIYSFNNPKGMCPVCRGLGKEFVLNEDTLIDWGKTLAEGAIRHPDYAVGGYYWKIVAGSDLFDMHKPLRDFGKEELDKLLYAKRVRLREHQANRFYKVTYEGVVTATKRRQFDKEGISEKTIDRDLKYFTLVRCSGCGGSRLNERARSVKVHGLGIPDLVAMELVELMTFLDKDFGVVAEPIMPKMKASLSRLIDIGVGYLSLNQAVHTLSGGEAQRVKMARQLGCSLVDLIYIMDEPSIGLHPRDISQLIAMLKGLRDQNNSVLVVEHDPDIIESADFIIDIGPAAGSNGGRVTFSGTVAELAKSKTITASALDSYRRHWSAQQFTRRTPSGSIEIKDASINNLKDITIGIPTGVFVCVTGVAGSGKSSLVIDVFAREHPEAIVIDQSPVGRSIRSNPATYTGVFDYIRNEFARANDVKPGLFSFNSRGACHKCKGLGATRVEMHFLDSASVVCDACEGKRYTSEVLRLQYQGKNIAEVLKMTVAEAAGFFESSEIQRRLKILKDVGLDYLEMGQALSSLSGGEIQRVKLASELYKKGNIYIMDEPTRGLHLADIKNLSGIIDALVGNGNTVIVIEHNLDLIKRADWIIDMGPDGGAKGGMVVGQGTPEDIIKIKNSYTGKYLKDFVMA